MATEYTKEDKVSKVTLSSQYTKDGEKHRARFNISTIMSPTAGGDKIATPCGTISKDISGDVLTEKITLDDGTEISAAQFLETCSKFANKWKAE